MSVIRSVRLRHNLDCGGSCINSTPHSWPCTQVTQPSSMGKADV